MIAIDGGVAAAMIHKECDSGNRKGKPKMKDFVKLNATAVMAGVVNAKVGWLKMLVHVITSNVLKVHVSALSEMP